MTSVATPLLTQVWQAVSGESTLPADVDLSGPSDLLSSVFPVIELGAAAVAASLLAAARLQAVRSGSSVPGVALERAHLACALRSEHHAWLNGEPVRGGFALLSQFFPTADGWIRLHANYDWHRERMLRVLGAPAEPAAVAAAVARWPGVELEDAIHAAGGCAAVVRDPATWRAHPQGQALAGLPLLEVRPTPEAGPPLPAAGRLPTSGLRVLDLTRVIAGPVCTRTLGAHGADVLRIDSPDLPETPGHALDSLAGKRSALLDLRRSHDRQRFDDLLAAAHVVVLGYRPAALAAFGLDPAILLARQPGLIVVSLSAWGPVGPWAERRGFDSLVQAASGIAVSEAAGRLAPAALPAQLLDHATGYLSAAAILAALAQRHESGAGAHIRVSLAQTAAWLLAQPLTARPSVPRQDVDGLDCAGCLVELDGPAGRVRLVNPPGRIGGRQLTWRRSPGVYGAAAPTWDLDQT